MLFIKIGHRWLNIAHVAEVLDENPDLVKVRMNVPLGAPISFKGDEAQAVRYFFRLGHRHELDVLDITPEACMEAHP